mmetsp:Transcript_117582/g.332647  ORF Transcript_117582/g.332647 Transcript_117582/m.332647 type:complete len:280 (-) Transcript_117582:337-1176(-)
MLLLRRAAGGAPALGGLLCPCAAWSSLPRGKPPPRRLPGLPPPGGGAPAAPARSAEALRALGLPPASAPSLPVWHPRPPPRTSRPPPGLPPNILTQMLMCRSADSLLNVRPQCGHWTLSGSIGAGPAAAWTTASSSFKAFKAAVASSSPLAAFCASMACLNSSDFIFHFGICFALAPPSVAFPPGPGGFFPPGCSSAALTFSTSFSIFLALLMSWFAFSNSPKRFAALSNFLRFCMKTFLQIFWCLSRAASAKLRPQSSHWTSGPGGGPSSSAPGGMPP